MQLNNEQEVQGKLSRWSFKNGVLKSVMLKMKNGEKRKYTAKDIFSIYMPLDLKSKIEGIKNMTFGFNNKSDKIGEEFVKSGYAYFEKHNVNVEGKIHSRLFQLLNPGFCENIKVYYSSNSQTTSSTSIYDVKIKGSNARSYYIKKKSEAFPHLIRKVDYKNKQYAILFLDCPELLSLKKKEKKWKFLEKHISMYNELK
jgi:hypothetical protein